jgi:NAD(P)-dependent dehydrogenase (short-subunit alcohol dehydrogenase family)
LKNKIVLITGGTSGVGKATALKLSALGAKVVLIARDKARAMETIGEIKSKISGADPGFIPGDLSSLQSIRTAAETFIAEYPRLDVLINNAGGVFDKFQKTKDGFEWAFQVNYLGHFLLTRLLIKKLEQSEDPRIINLSSEAHRMGKIDFDNLNCEKSFGTWPQYGATKLMNVLFTKELKNRYKNISSFSLHPGVVRTGFGANNTGLLRFFSSLPFLLTPEQGAETSVYLATTPRAALKNGEYYKKSKVTPSSAITYQKETAARLWEISEQMLHDKGF